MNADEKEMVLVEVACEQYAKQLQRKADECDEIGSKEWGKHHAADAELLRAFARKINDVKCIKNGYCVPMPRAQFTTDQ